MPLVDPTVFWRHFVRLPLDKNQIAADENFFHHIERSFPFRSKLLELSLRNDNHCDENFHKSTLLTLSHRRSHGNPLLLFPFVRQAFYGCGFFKDVFIPFQSAT
jgi:hypothetical protein